MKTTLSAFALVLGAAAVPAADPATAPKGPPLDTSFLKLYAETRGFMLGRPQKPKITPDGKAVLFLRAESRRGFTSPVGFGQGTYRIGRAGGRARVSRAVPGAATQDLDGFLAEVERLASESR